MAESSVSVTVDADLTLTIDESECAVWSEADLLVVNAPTLSAARKLLDGVETLPAGPDGLVTGLERTGQTVELRVQHAPVARAGADVEPSRLAALAGYDGTVSLRGVAVAVYRRLL